MRSSYFSTITLATCPQFVKQVRLAIATNNCVAVDELPRFEALRILAKPETLQLQSQLKWRAGL